MFDSIKAQLFTPSSFVIAFLYYLLVIGGVTTYDMFHPMFAGMDAKKAAGK